MISNLKNQICNSKLLNFHGCTVLCPTFACMKRWGLRASSLSAVAKADAGQNTSYNHLNPNVLYMMLCGVFHFSFVCINNFFVALGVKTLTQYVTIASYPYSNLSLLFNTIRDVAILELCFSFHSLTLSK